jgi:hypothetical protein
MKSFARLFPADSSPRPVSAAAPVTVGWGDSFASGFLGRTEVA